MVDVSSGRQRSNEVITILDIMSHYSCKSNMNPTGRNHYIEMVATEMSTFVAAITVNMIFKQLLTQR